MRFPRLFVLVPLTFSAIALHAQTSTGPADSLTFQAAAIQTPNGAKVASVARVDGTQDLYVPPVPNAPFSATVLLNIGGVGRLPANSYSSVARDSAGRVVIENRTTAFSHDLVDCSGSSDVCNSNPPAQETPNLRDRIYIDPVRQTYYNCTVKDHLCHALPYQSAITQRPENGLPFTPTTQSIGQKKIDGLQTIGTRKTTAPYHETDETWYSRDLQINLLTKRTILNKTQSLQVKDPCRSEPNPKLFTLPSGYKNTSNPPPPLLEDANAQALRDQVRTTIEKSN